MFMLQMQADREERHAQQEDREEERRAQREEREAQWKKE